jgi:L-gulonolactone oxidase
VQPVPPRDRDGRFRSWSGVHASAPTRWHLPETEEQVAAAVRDAHRLRVVGAGHSFSPVAVPEGAALSLDRLRGWVALDRDAGTVTCPAGMRLRDLSAALASQGWTLPIVGSIQAQAVAGAVATGTHGSSLVHGNLSSLLTAARLVDGTGEVHALDATDPRFEGLRVHLGALGVLTQVTLRAEPAFRLRQQVEHVPVHEVAGQLAQVARSAEYVKVWWLPHAPTAQVVRYTRTTEPATRRPSSATLRTFDEKVLHRWLFPVMIRVQHRRPGWVPGINARLSRSYLGPAVQVGASSLVLNTPMPVVHRETEAAVPLERAGEAFARTVALVERERLAANFPLEARFVPGDRAWLSPAYGGDTCQLGAYTTDGPHRARFFAGFWEQLRPLGARPHWGKELDHDATELAALYPELDRFRALRDVLDPQRVFDNAFLRQVLGD